VASDTAIDGLELVERLSPEAVLIGTQPPDMPPPAVVEEIRSFSGVPIVVLSRGGDEIEAVTSLELGADDYIRFPCGMLEIMARVFRLLHLLAKNRGIVVSRQSLEQSLWADRGFNSQVAKKYVQRLRQKLGDCAAEPRWIASVPGVGYRFIGPKPCQQDVLVGRPTANLIRSSSPGARNIQR
jgi:two-component system KDP operon response regulator KdpE